MFTGSFPDRSVHPSVRTPGWGELGQVSANSRAVRSTAQCLDNTASRPPGCPNTSCDVGWGKRGCLDSFREDSSFPSVSKQFHLVLIFALFPPTNSFHLFFFRKAHPHGHLQHSRFALSSINPQQGSLARGADVSSPVQSLCNAVGTPAMSKSSVKERYSWAHYKLWDDPQSCELLSFISADVNSPKQF